MSRFFIILLGLVALSILARFCININTPQIEDDLAVRTQKALLEQGKSFAQVGVDGRDIYLSGIAPSQDEIKNVVEISTKVFGVRRVVNQLGLDRAVSELEPQTLARDSLEDSTVEIVEQPSETHTSKSIELNLAKEPESLKSQHKILYPVVESPYRTGFSYKDGELVLTGVVADESSHLWLSNRAQEIFGKGNVDDQLRVAYGAPQGWHNTAETALTNLVMFSKAEASIVDNVLTIRGPSISEKLKERVEADVNAGIGQSYIAKFDIGESELSSADLVKGGNTPLNAAMPSKCQWKLDKALEGQAILFDTNKAVIKRKSHVLLEQLSVIVKECSESSIEVGGHTDSRGKKLHNQKLSELRAKAVVLYLQKQGVPAKKLTAKGYGELMPVTDNNSVKGMASNRRIEFKVGRE